MLALVGSCLRMVHKTKQVGFEPVFESLDSWSISYGGWDFIPNVGGAVAGIVVSVPVPVLMANGFIVTFHSNYAHILYCFGYKASYWSKIVRFSYPLH